MASGIGSDGIVEIFLPPGGTAGQALVKIDTQNYNATWGAGGAGGGIGSISAGTTNLTGPGISFSNANGVSFGVNGNTITASVAAAGGAQTGISSLIAGQTQTVGALSFSNASGVSFGIVSGALTGTFTASVRTDYQSSNANYLTSQSNQAFSAQGGSSAFQTLVFTNSNGVSFSNTNGSVWASVAAQSNQTVASGNIAGSGVTTAGNNIGLSGTLNSNGLSLSATVAAQTNQSAGIYASSQTFGQSSSSTYDARSVTFVGSGAVSVGWSNSSLLFSVPVQSVQTQASGAIAGTGFTSAGANISLSGTLNTAGLSLSASVAAQSNQSAIKGLGASNTGNTAGNTGISSGVDWVFAGSNNITISESTVGGGPNTLWVSGPSVGGAQTGISGIIVSNTTYTSGTVSFSNANGASFGSSAGQAITISYTVPTVTNSSWTVSDNGTSGTVARLAFTNLNGVTLSLSTGAGGSHTIVGSHNAITSQSNQTGGLYASSQTTGSASSGTYDARSITLIGAGIVSVGNHSTSAGGTTTGFIISATQSNQAFSAAGGSSAFQTLGFSDNAAASWTNTNGSVAIASVRASLYATSNTTQSSTGTANLNSLIFAGAGIASVGITNGSIVVSVPSGGGGGDGGVFAGVSTMGNTAGSTGTVSTGVFVLAGSGGISLSQSTGAAGSAATVTISAPNSSLLSGVNGISLSTTGSTICISGLLNTNSWWQPEVYGNTFTTTFANNTVYFRPVALDGYYNVNNVILQMSGSSSATTASFSGSIHTSAAGSDVASSGTGSYGLSGTVLFFSRVNTNETHADFTKIITFDSHTYSIGAGYSASVSYHMSSSSATVSVTTSGAVSWIANVNSTGGITTSQTTSSSSTTFSSTSTNAQTISSSFILSFPYANLSGFRPIFAPMSGSTVSPGQYWIGLQQSTASGSTNMSLQRVAMLASAHMLVYTISTNSYAEIGNPALITSSNWRLGFGSHSASNATTTTMGLTAITSMSSNASVYLAFNGNTR